MICIYRNYDSRQRKNFFMSNGLKNFSLSIVYLSSSIYLFIGYRVFVPVCDSFSGCGEQGLHSSCGVQAFHCGGFSLCGRKQGVGSGGVAQRHVY